MKKQFYFIIIFFSLTACESFKEKAGLVKYQPDEYQVVTNPPLTVPPDFNIHSPEEIIAKKNSVEENSGNGANLTQGENYILQNIKQK